MNEQTNNDEIEIDLVELFYVLRKRLVLIVAVAFLAALVTGLLCKFVMKPQYSSTSKLYVLTKSTSVTSIADIQVGSSLTTDYMELINSRPVVEKVINNLNLTEETYGSLRSRISVENPQDTRILAITVTYDSPEMAKTIVDNVAEVCQESISKIMDQEQPNLIEEGYVNENQVAPTTMKNSAIAGILAAILMMAIIVIRHLLDDTIKSSEDVEKYLQLNTLALIPYKEEDEN